MTNDMCTCVNDTTVLVLYITVCILYSPLSNQPLVARKCESKSKYLILVHGARQIVDFSDTSMKYVLCVSIRISGAR